MSSVEKHLDELSQLVNEVQANVSIGKPVSLQLHAMTVAIVKARDAHSTEVGGIKAEAKERINSILENKKKPKASSKKEPEKEPEKAPEKDAKSKEDSKK